jgi:hypothetical protein
VCARSVQGCRVNVACRHCLKKALEAGRVAEVVAVPLSESGQERLGDQIIGNLVASAAGEVAVNVRSVPVKQNRELLWLPPGPLNDRSIIRDGGSTPLPHARP